MNQEGRPLRPDHARGDPQPSRPVVAEEMQTTLLKSSCSPIVKEGLDASASLFTLDGTTLAQACAIPIHLATLNSRRCGDPQRAFPAEHDAGGRHINLLNDPDCGGTHLPISLWSCPCSRAAGHRTRRDHDPPPRRRRASGGLGTDRRDRDLSGGHPHPGDPPGRERGVLDPTITAVLRQNVRIPDIFMGDLHAQIAACKIAGMRLQRESIEVRSHSPPRSRSCSTAPRE